MTGEVWCVVMPAVAEALLVGCCLTVWLRLRHLGITGVCRWTLVVVGLDAVAQGMGLWAQLGQPAGLGWLVHTGLCYVVVYVLYRLGELLWRLRQSCACDTSTWPEMTR